ncbi:MAG: DUF1461 domain-containing protein [Clostridiales Family XIII bacterium]|jgi:hypothetical protein|nr:DUF1461 domain-containing protein [Clostridiales Family XIII bacterium]
MEYRLDALSVATKAWLIAACVFIAVALPAAVFLTATNIAFKIDDVYKYELDKTGAASEAAYGASGGDVGAALSEYMRHDSDDLILIASAFDEEIKVFTENDKAAMAKFRKILDMGFILVMALWPSLIVVFILVARKEKKRYLRNAFRGSVAGFAFIFALVMAFANSQGIRNRFVSGLLRISFSEDDALPQLFSSSFPLSAGVIISIIAFVIFAILFYFTHRFYRETNIYRYKRDL